MRPYQKTIGDQTYFALAEVEAVYHAALPKLHYTPFEEGFARAFPANTPHLDRYFVNFARDMPALVRQAAEVEVAPWEQALQAFVELIANADFDWLLVGSAALAVRGLAVHPHDLDLVVQGNGTARLRDLLLPHMLELHDSRGWIWDWFGRAFLYARIEWAGDVNASADAEGVTDFGLTAYQRAETILWRGYPVRVPPLDLQLIGSEQRGLTERAALIRAALP